MKEKPEAKCLNCGSLPGFFPDQDGSCDWYCTKCGWHQHIPAKLEGGSKHGVAVSEKGHRRDHPHHPQGGGWQTVGRNYKHVESGSGEALSGSCRSLPLEGKVRQWCLGGFQAKATTETGRFVARFRRKSFRRSISWSVSAVK